jgi:hypothetical protein
VQRSAGNGGTQVLAVDTTNSQLSVRGINSDATLGSELSPSNDFANTGWGTTGAPWTTTTTTATHPTGNTSSLVDGQFTANSAFIYQVSFTVSGSPTAGEYVTPVMGVSGKKVYGNVTETQVFTNPFNLSNLMFTPTTNWNGTISNVSVKIITPSKSTLNLLDSAGTTSLQLRASGGSAINSFIGLKAGQSNITGFANTAVGASALLSNASGTYNSAFGSDVLLSNTTGSSNTAMGYSSLISNTSGSNNTGAGYGALQSNSTGIENVATGYYALQQNIYGTKNTASGSYALQYSADSNNTAMGYYALNGLNGGSNNTAIGYQAGYTSNSANALYNSSNNTFIGYNAGPGVSPAAGLQNSTAIGQASVVSASDTLALGCVSGVNGCSTTTKVSIASGGYANSALTVGATNYSTGTFQNVSPPTSTMTGTGTTWNSGMVGGTVYFSNGSSDTITGFTDTTHITTSTTHSFAASSTYTIVYGGLNATATGTASLQPASDSSGVFSVKNATGTTVFNVDTTSTGSITSSGAVIGAAGIYTGASGGTQRLDSTGNLLNIGNITTTGASTLTVGGANGLIIKPGTDNTAVFQVQKAGSSTAIFTADTSGNKLQVGSATTDTTGVLLILDSYNNSGAAGDPSGTNGAMYYNTFSNTFRCYENGAWTNCLSSVKTYQTFAVVANTTVPSTTVPTDTITQTNMGTTFKYFGNATLAKMDGYTTARLLVRAADGAAQSGVTTCAIRNITDATDMVTMTFSDTTLSNREASASVSLTGIKKLAVYCKSANATDDPIFGDMVIQIER